MSLAFASGKCAQAVYDMITSEEPLPQRIRGAYTDHLSLISSDQEGLPDDALVMLNSIEARLRSREAETGGPRVALEKLPDEELRAVARDVVSLFEAVAMWANAA